MKRLLEQYIRFFDSVTLFADYWIKHSDIQLKFSFHSDLSKTKAVFELLPSDKDELALFQKDVLRHFNTTLTENILFSDKKVVVFLCEDEQNEQSTNGLTQESGQSQ